MYRFIVTFVLFFVTLIAAAELRSETKIYTYDLFENITFNSDFTGIHNGGSRTVSKEIIFVDGTILLLGFELVQPSDDYRIPSYGTAYYKLAGWNVTCVGLYTKNGYPPLSGVSIPVSFSINVRSASVRTGYVKCSVSVKSPNWDDPDDPFGDGGGGGDDPTDTDGDGTPDDDDDDDDNDGTPDVSDPDPEDPDVPGDDDDDDDDPDDDPENACTCGACCSCKCTCGLWSAEICSGTCWHYGHGDSPMPPEVAGGYCECHHQEDDGEEEEECCEHHAAIQEATERAADASESIDDKLDGISDKLTYSTQGDLSFSMPSFEVPDIDVPLPSIPDVSVPSLSLPEVGEVTERPLTYFERRGFGELPSFNYAKLYLVLSEAVEDKFGLMSLSNKFNNPSGGGFDLSFTIDFQLPAPFNVRVGPHKVDVRGVINDYASLPIANVIRLVVLAYLGICFISALVKIVFLTPW